MNFVRSHPQHCAAVQSQSNTAFSLSFFLWMPRWIPQEGLVELQGRCCAYMVLTERAHFCPPSLALDISCSHMPNRCLSKLADHQFHARAHTSGQTTRTKGRNLQGFSTAAKSIGLTPPAPLIESSELPPLRGRGPGISVPRRHPKPKQTGIKDISPSFAHSAGPLTKPAGHNSRSLQWSRTEFTPPAPRTEPSARPLLKGKCP